MADASRALFLLTLLCCSQLAPAQTRVRVQPVEAAPIVEELPLSGTIRSPRYSDLSTQVSGVVQEIRVEVGDLVNEGDVLLVVDDELQQLEVRRLQARQQEAQLRFDDAQRLATEAGRLVREQSFSKSQYDTLVAQQATEAVRLQQMEAELNMARVNLRRHTLRAPFSGIIGFKHAEVGEWLAAGSPALQLVQTHPLRVQASIPERYFEEVRSGTPVRITVDAYTGKVIEASVDTVVTSAEFNTRSFLAWLDIPNLDGRLAPGMSAHLVLLLGAAENGGQLRVAADAIVRSTDGQAWVWVIRDGKAHRVTVDVGRRNRSFVEVAADDLRAGDLAITLGNENLQPGMAVQAVQAE
jgi:RND family efflux transporter MFP subunit